MVAFHGIFFVGPSRVSDLRFFFGFYNVSVSPFQGFGGNFPFVCILPTIQI